MKMFVVGRRVKIFVVGRPGCGKSLAARYIEELAKREKLSVARVNDYAILQEMFQADKKREQFRPTEDQKGFDVIDFSVLDTALKNAEQQAKKELRTNNVVIIEFARDDYEVALRQFSKKFLKNAYFLFIDSNVATCIHRISKRVKNRCTCDDYNVSERIMRSYYKEQHLPRRLKSRYGIDEERVRPIYNQGDLSSFKDKVNRFTNFVLVREVPYQNLNGVLREINEKLARSVGTIKATPHLLPTRSALKFFRA